MSRGKNKPLLVVLCVVAASAVASLVWALVASQTSGTSDQIIILFFYGVLVLTFLSTGLAFTLRPRLLHPAMASTSASTASDAPPEYRDTWRREYMNKIRHEAEEPGGVTAMETGGRRIGPNAEAECLPPYSLYSQETPTLHMFQNTPTATELHGQTSVSQPEAYTGNLDRLAWVFGEASRVDTQRSSSQPEGINTENRNQLGASRVSTYSSSSQPVLHAANQDRLARMSTRGTSRVDDLSYETVSSGDSLFLKAMLHTASSHPA